MLLCVQRNALLHLFCRRNETIDLALNPLSFLLIWFCFSPLLDQFYTLLRISTFAQGCCGGALLYLSLVPLSSVPLPPMGPGLTCS